MEGQADYSFSGFFNNIVKQLKPITDLLNKEGYEAIICDDSENGASILPLKLAAIRAGFGWQGKNSLLINKKYGSFLALGGILTNATLDYSSPEEVNRCKSCNKCQQACPTKALDESYLLDKNKCLSYLLQNDNFPEEAKSFVKNKVMDCEICQEACPWNNKHIKNPLNTELTESFKNEAPKWLEFFSVPKLINLTESEYKAMLGYLDTGVAYELFCRNVEMVYENYRSL
ncbi:MAG: epoxyqueuosine reductase [Methanococcaceae archaeon]